MQKKKGLFNLISLLVISTVLLAGCQSESETKTAEPNTTKVESTKVITAKLGHVMAVDSPANIGALKFAELIKEKTDGQVVVDVYPNSQLGGDRDMIEAQKMGALDFSLPGSSIFSQFEPTVGVFVMPFIFKDKEAAYKILDGEVGKEIYKVTENQNIKTLVTFESGFRQLGTNKPVNGIDDIKGLKIRIPEGDIYIKTWKSLGASGTPLAWNELFSALQTGVVDGEEAPLATFATSGFGEVTKNFAYINYAYDPLMLTVSNAFWDKLTVEQQKAVEESAVEASAYQRQVNEDLEKTLEKDLIDKEGVAFTHPDLAPFQEAVKSVYKEYQYQDQLNMILDGLK